MPEYRMEVYKIRIKVLENNNQKLSDQNLDLAVGGGAGGIDETAKMFQNIKNEMEKYKETGDMGKELANFFQSSIKMDKFIINALS